MGTAGTSSTGVMSADGRHRDLPWPMGMQGPRWRHWQATTSADIFHRNLPWPMRSGTEVTPPSGNYISWYSSLCDLLWPMGKLGPCWYHHLATMSADMFHCLAQWKWSGGDNHLLATLSAGMRHRDLPWPMGEQRPCQRIFAIAICCDQQKSRNTGDVIICHLDQWERREQSDVIIWHLDQCERRNKVTSSSVNHVSCDNRHTNGHHVLLNLAMAKREGFSGI